MADYNQLAEEIYNRTNLANFGNYRSQKSKGFQFKNEIDKLGFLIVCFDGEIGNGGFLTFYRNGGGYCIPEIKECLEKVGDTESINMLEETYKIYLKNQQRIDDGDVYDSDGNITSAFKILSMSGDSWTMKYWNKEKSARLYFEEYLEKINYSH